MPSPFPGMNPYLEVYAWRDFHTAFNVAARTALRQVLGERYGVFVEWDVVIHEPPAEERQRFAVADVALSDRQKQTAPASGQSTRTAAPAQASIAVDLIEERHRRVEIRDRQNDRLVTVVELLSPANKADDGRTAYLSKRQQYLIAGVNLVEIDLLRGGRVLPMSPQPASPYYALVARLEDEGTHGLWPIGLRDPLPTIPVPLRSPDPDAQLDLQALLNGVYDEASYGRVLYARDLKPPLSPEDQAWAEGMLREASSRR